MLPYDATRVANLCRELEDWRRRFDYKGPLSRAWEGRLRRDLEAAAVAASTSMEGVPVTVDDVRRILVGDIPPAVSEDNRELVEGYRNSMEFVLRRADDPTFRWARELIVGLHDRILAGHYAAGAGRLRTRQVYVANTARAERVFRPPPPDEVPALIDELCDTMEQRRTEVAQPENHPAVLAAWLHVAFAAIHPFVDGNGRVARVLASLAMYRGGFKRREFTTLEEWWGRHLHQYYAAFGCLGAEFDRSADVTPFVEAHVQAQVGQVRGLDLRERVERRIWTTIENLVVELGLDPRVANAVWDAFFEREVTAGYYRQLADVSPATATNDLASAVAARLLRAEGQRRGRHYRPGLELYRRVAEEIGLASASSDHADRTTIIGELTRRLATPPGTE